LLSIILALVLSSTSPPSASASAGWYPAEIGDLIITDFCVPAGSRSPIFLQTMGNASVKKTVAIIRFKRLKIDSYCRKQAKYGLLPVGLYHLEYKWKVNIQGSWGLQLYIPNLEIVAYGWPDGIQVGNY